MVKKTILIDTRIPTIMEYIKTKVPKEGLLSSRFYCKCGKHRVKTPV